MSSFSEDGLFGGLFHRGGVQAGDEAWLQAMLDAEAGLARAAERAGLVPPGSGAAVTSAARARFIQNKDLSAGAAGPGNPVPPLVRALTELVSRAAPDSAAAVHLGATSQDIIDTAAMLVSARAIEVIDGDLRAAAQSCAELASAHVSTVMAGRTLLQQAVPVTFGFVAAGWLTALSEARAGLLRIRTERLAVQYGGAAGTLAPLGADGPRVADLLGEELGLAVPVLPWHTDRLRIIELGAALTGACAALGKIGRDVTLLAQTEVAEVAQAAGGGSSAMPHKQNPVAAIIILGCAKRAPGLLATLAATAEQEYQRAAGAWHAEWETLSDLLTLTGSAASWAADLLGGLRVDPERMRVNLDASAGLPMAEHVATVLAPALGRLAAHDLVAAASARAAADHTDLASALLNDEPAAAQLIAAGFSPDQIRAATDPESYLGASAEFIRRAVLAARSPSGAF